MWRRLAITVLSAAALHAQAAFEISGVVLDKATNQGIAGVTVFLSPPAGAIAPFEYREVLTDAAGRFRVTIHGEGVYRFSVANVRGYQSGSAAATVAAGNREAAVRILLDRATDVRGLVIDADTREPVAGLALFLTSVSWSDGRLKANLPGIRVTTDVDGRFRDSALYSERWAVHIVPRLWATSTRHLMEFSEQDLQEVDEDYEESYWPGGGDLEAALPLRVAPGVPTDFGVVQVRKATYYRARLRLAPGSCEPGTQFAANLLRVSGPGYIDDGRFPMRCGYDVLLRGLQAGTSYVLSMSSNGQYRDQIAYATLPFRVADSNLDLTASPALGADLEGRVVLTEGARTLPTQTLLTLSEPWLAREAPPFRNDPTATPATEGRFRFVNARRGETSLTVTELGPAHIATEVSFNGTPLAGPPYVFDWQGRGTLEIEVDDLPALITGTVTDGNGGGKRTLVFLYPWPRTGARDMVLADEQGKFQSPSLRPGEYRVLAIPVEARERIEEPGVLDRLLPRAEKVTVQRGGSVSVTLPLLDPGR